MPKKHTDFVIITALQEELAALLTQFPSAQRLPPAEEDIRVYYQASLPVTLLDGTTGQYQLLLLSLHGMGRLQAANATHDALHRWHPRYLLLVGLAGGIAAAGLGCGDVVIASQIVDYELQKVTDEGEKVRWEVYRADARLLEAARHLGEDWQSAITQPRPEPGQPRSFIGPVACGDKVMAYTPTLERYRNDWPALLGIEMEASGVASAASQSPSQPGLLMIRGISDLADAQKDDRWRPYACQAAALCTLALLQSGPVRFSQQSEETFFTRSNRLWQPSLPPATLLRPEYGVVPFWGRERELASLTTWCESEPAALVRLYLGSGGMGKTRLLLHGCQMLRQTGWQAGFLKASAPLSRDACQALLHDSQPCLIVVDYAEHRRSELTVLLTAAAHLPAQRRVRLILLARSAGEWVHLLRGEGSGAGDLMLACQHIYLDPLARSGAERLALFHEALTTFSSRLGRRVPSQIPEQLSDKHFERILLLHTAALAAIEGVKVKGDGDSLLDFLLDREMAYWQRRAHQLQLPAYLSPAFRQAMAVITLIGGAGSSEEALDLLQSLPLLQGTGPAILRALADILHECYPGEAWIEPLQPDLLGEYLGDLALSEDSRLYELILGPPGKDAGQ